MLGKGISFSMHNNQFLSIEVKISDLLPISLYCKYQLTEEKLENKVYGKHSLVYFEAILISFLL